MKLGTGKPNILWTSWKSSQRRWHLRWVLESGWAISRWIVVASIALHDLLLLISKLIMSHFCSPFTSQCFLSSSNGLPGTLNSVIHSSSPSIVAPLLRSSSQLFPSFTLACFIILYSTISNHLNFHLIAFKLGWNFRMNKSFILNNQH